MCTHNTLYTHPSIWNWILPLYLSRFVLPVLYWPYSSMNSIMPFQLDFFLIGASERCSSLFPLKTKPNQASNPALNSTLIAYPDLRMTSLGEVYGGPHQWVFQDTRCTILRWLQVLQGIDLLSTQGTWMKPHLQLAAALFNYPMFHLIFYVCHKMKWFGKHWCVLFVSLTPLVLSHSFLNPLQFGFSLFHSHPQHIHPIGLFLILFDDTYIVTAHFSWLLP